MSSDFTGTGRTATGRRLGVNAGLAGAFLLIGSLIGWSGAAIGAGPAGHPAPVTAPAPAPAAARDRAIGGGVDSYSALVDQIAPAVATVRSERRVRTSGRSPMPDNPLFREFFGDRFGPDRAPREFRQGGLGSGVVVRPDGYLLTNNHVVDGAEHVQVELTDGRTFTAKVVGTDEPSDLAVLKIDGSNLQTLPLGDSDKVRVGDVALAIGNPLGVGQTVTMGIVSAKGRQSTGGNDTYEDFIQTDAPINEGNSGGALVNTRGELIGINSQILTPSGGNIGIGFAIPANMARNVMTQLIDHGSVRRGLLGITVQPVTPEIARSLGIGAAHGALVNSVQAGGAAERAGVRRGDVITAVNGQAVKNGNTLRNEIAQMMPGTDTRLTVLRDGKEQTFNVKLGELRAEEQASSSDRKTDAERGGFGLTLEPLTRETASQLGVKATSGVVVVEVAPSSRAADAGLRSGDVIEEVDGTKVASADSLRSALTRSSDKPALLLVHRGANTMFVPLERAN
jgi:serine protease Do